MSMPTYIALSTRYSHSFAHTSPELMGYKIVLNYYLPYYDIFAFIRGRIVINVITVSFIFRGLYYFSKYYIFSFCKIRNWLKILV